MQSLVIVGAGGHGRDVLDVIDAMNAAAPRFEFVGFLDDDAEAGKWFGLERLGPVSRLAELTAQYVIAIGDSRARRRIDAVAQEAGRTAATLVHPTASMGRQVELGPGCVLMAGVRVTNHVTMGRHVHVNQNATVGHDCTLGDYVTLSPLVALSGAVNVGAVATLGTGAVVVPGKRVGADSVVGAGAAVVDDVPDGITVVGVPARPVSSDATPPA